MLNRVPMTMMMLNAMIFFAVLLVSSRMSLCMMVEAME